jgi:hypothetical protein
MVPILVRFREVSMMVVLPIATVLPMYSAPTIPTPPATVSAPVVVLVDAVVADVDIIPLNLAFPVTSSFSVGETLPIPRLPAAVNRIFSDTVVPPVAVVKKLR